MYVSRMYIYIYYIFVYEFNAILEILLRNNVITILNVLPDSHFACEP